MPPLGPGIFVPGYALTSLVPASLAVQGAKLTWAYVSEAFAARAAPTDYRLFFALVFLSVAIANVAVSASSFLAVWKKSLTMAQHVDRCLLILAVMIPSMNIAGCLALPSFLMSKAWPAYLVFLQLLSGVIFRVPPMHALISWLVHSLICG